MALVVPSSCLKTLNEMGSVQSAGSLQFSPAEFQSLMSALKSAIR